MQSAGVVTLRLNLSATYVEHRFIVCDPLLSGVDIIIGTDFLRDRCVVVEYNARAVHLKLQAHSHYITFKVHDPFSKSSQTPKVISAVKAQRAVRKGA
jgi:hypothetical protein